MGAAWVDHPSWEMADQISAASDRDIEKLLLETPADELTQTRNAQIATFALSVIILDAVERIGLAPALVAGHSLGEYTALVASGILNLNDGSKLVSARGDAMQSAASDRPGTMYAVLGLADELVDVACRRADGDVWVANYNSPGQVVIAGDPNDLAKAGEFAKQLGAKKVVPIPVGGAFHTPYMRPARQHLLEAISKAEFELSDVPVIANVDGMVHEGIEEWPALMAAQLCAPVRWHQSISVALEQGASVFVECGAGGVLSGLMKRCAPDATVVSVAEPKDLDVLLDIITNHHQPKQDPPKVPNGNQSNTHNGFTKSEVGSNGKLAPHGEPLFITERLVVSPVAGIFAPTTLDLTESNTTVEVGTLIGHVASSEVRSPFAGTIMGMLAKPGERVTIGQPIAWLRTDHA